MDHRHQMSHCPASFQSSSHCSLYSFSITTTRLFLIRISDVIESVLFLEVARCSTLLQETAMLSWFGVTWEADNALVYVILRAEADQVSEMTAEEWCTKVQRQPTKGMYGMQLILRLLTLPFYIEEKYYITHNQTLHAHMSKPFFIRIYPSV